MEKEIKSLEDCNNIYFVGVAGVGMSAIAQYLSNIGKTISGSDRYFDQGNALDIKAQLEEEKIKIFSQDGSGITASTDVVVVSTAIEDSIIEVRIAKEKKIPILRRSQLLSLIANSKRTIAIGGTSGKSTTSAMLFHILDHAGLGPSIISGAGLTNLIKKGKIGNAAVGNGDFLVIEADESDGSIVQYNPEVGLLLNIDKDHNDLDELASIFNTFKNNSTYFITNQSHALASKLSADTSHDFATEKNEKVKVNSDSFDQKGFTITFNINNVPFQMNAIGQHTMENATAAVTCALYCGVDIQTSSKALQNYEGIYRRHQILGTKNGVIVIDDYGHNPVKCAASIAACQPLGNRVIAWFQPHGYGPTQFLKDDFISELSNVLRDEDQIWFSEIFYAGGTAEKTISAKELADGINANGKNSFFVADRENLLKSLKETLQSGDVLLFMGARDPSLATFVENFYKNL